MINPYRLAGPMLMVTLILSSFLFQCVTNVSEPTQRMNPFISILNYFRKYFEGVARSKIT